MAISSAETGGSILVTCQQTRFHLTMDSDSREIDIKGLSIVIASNDNLDTLSAAKKKARSQTDGLEILSNAALRLKTGVHYALLGRNGTGKSTLLKAPGNGLIPGIPMKTRVALLQQTTNNNEAEEAEIVGEKSNRTVLQQVVEADPYRNELLRDFNVLSEVLESKQEPESAVWALRQIQHGRLRNELLEVQKLANYRSGARGSEARKVLIAYEKRFGESQALLEQTAFDMDSEAVETESQAALDLYNDLQAQLETMKIADIEIKARMVLSGLGFKEPQLQKQFSDLSGGWQMRCLLAATLTQASDLLILDEPTNYLDLFGILWLQHYLDSLKETFPDTTLVLVSHDRDFVNAVCSETILLRDKSLVYFNGNLDAYEKSIRHSILRMTRMKEAQEKQVSHMEKTIANNIRQGKKTGDDNRLRQAKSRQKKVEDRMGLQVSATGGRFKLNRDKAGWQDKARDDIEIPEEERGVSMQFPEAPDLRFPGSLLSVENVTFSYARAPKPTLQDVSLVIHMGDKIGVLGLNGAGKSTLISLLTGTCEPKSGTITRHPRLKIGHYSQRAVELLQHIGSGDPTVTALSYLLRQASDISEDFSESAARGFLGSLGLHGRTVSDVPLVKLSGGQLVRLALASVLIERPHLLVIDEPTTHLDLPTVSALTRALVEFTGAVVLVSHDRFLIRCVVEGEPVDPDDSEDEEAEKDDVVGGSRNIKGRRIVYEVKGRKLIEKSGGVAAWERGLVTKLKKLSL